MTRRAPRRPPASAREGAQVHRARERAGEPRPSRIHRRDAERAARARPRRPHRRPPARERVGRRPPAARARRVRRAGHRRGRLRGHDRRRRRATASARCSSTSTSASRVAASRADGAGALAERRTAAGSPSGARWATKATRCSCPTAPERAALTDTSMATLARAHAAVGGEILSGGGTGTYDVNTVATEIQAGSYALMDTAYAKLGIPFDLALAVRRDRDPHEPEVVRRRLRAEGARHGPRQPHDRRRRRDVLLRRARHVHRRALRCASATACSCGPRTSTRRWRTTTRCTSPTVPASKPR